MLVDDPTLKASLPPLAEVVDWFGDTMQRRLGFGMGEALRHEVTFDMGSSPSRTVVHRWAVGQDGQVRMVRVADIPDPQQ